MPNTNERQMSNRSTHQTAMFILRQTLILHSDEGDYSVYKLFYLYGKSGK